MRRFEFVQGTSAKFWMTDVEGSTFVVVYGRLGTPGQRKEKGFPSPEAARREMEKKIAEKVREGYHEVAAAAGAAPAGAKGAAAASARLELPARLAKREATPERIQAAKEGLSALDKARGRRSWALAMRVRAARRALEGIAGFDPGGDAGLQQALDAVMERVIAPRATDRLPLSRAMELLQQLDSAAFARAVQESWKDAPSGTPAARAIGVLRKQLAELGEPELALRLAGLLVDRGAPGSTAGWTRRWKALSPHLEAFLIRGGGSLKKYLQAIDTGGDPQIARRVEGMRAA
jgi:predicted DNA-binding WGR domain protein